MNEHICSKNRVIRWDITQKCNLSCKHCITSNMYDSLVELSFEDKMKVIDKLAEGSVKKIHLLGGEATTVPKLGEIVSYASAKGIKISLNTNSVVLSKDKEMCRIFAEHEVGVSFSIDGVDSFTHDQIRGPGSFEKVLKAANNYYAETMENNDVTRAFYFTLTPDNRNNDFNILFKLASKYGINNIVIGIMIPEGNGKKNYEDTITIADIIEISVAILKISRKFPNIKLSFPFQTPLLLKYFNERVGTSFGLCYTKCKAGVQDYSLQPDGSLYPCIFTNHDSSFHRNFGVDNGENNLLFHSFDEIVSNSFYEKFIHLMNQKEVYDSVEPCKNCPYNTILDICRPCSLQHNDSIESKDFHRNEICKYILSVNDNNYYW